MAILNWEISEYYPFAENLFSPESTARWELLKKQLTVGLTLTGTVYIKAPFGVFFDAGLGFPILLEVTQFGKERVIFPEEYPALGSVVSGCLAGFADDNRQLRVTKATATEHL